MCYEIFIFTNWGYKKNDINKIGEAAPVDNKQEEEQLSPEELLKIKVYEGGERKYGTLTSEITERIDYELDVINSMGFASYFLIVGDLIEFSKKRNIRTGAGRGSAAGSIVSYCLGITGIEPLEYGLIFERFLNKT